MALANYNDLKSAVELWSGRKDIASAIDDGILMLEGLLNRELRHRRMLITTSTFAYASGQITHPTDWLQWKLISTSTCPRGITIVSDESLINIKDDLVSGRAQYAVVSGTTTEIYPAPVSATGITIKYYQKIPPVINSSVNWLLTDFPDIYLLGTLLAINGFARDTEEAMKWGQGFDRAFQSLKQNDADTSYGGSTLQIRNSR